MVTLRTWPTRVGHSYSSGRARVGQSSRRARRDGCRDPYSQLLSVSDRHDAARAVQDQRTPDFGSVLKGSRGRVRAVVIAGHSARGRPQSSCCSASRPSGCRRLRLRWGARAGGARGMTRRQANARPPTSGMAFPAVSIGGGARPSSFRVASCSRSRIIRAV
jgi:hypothetical protein